MQELICIETPEWELTISCQNLAIRQKTYFDMLKRRGATHSPNALHFKPEISLKNTSNGIIDPAECTTSLIKALSLPEPLFFENTQYQFAWIFFNDDITQASIAHPLQTIANSFRFTPKRKHSAASLIGTISTGNDIGMLNLPLVREFQHETNHSHSKQGHP